MPRLVLLPHAIQDMELACEWYAAIDTRLETRVQRELDARFQEILEFPRACAADEHGIRRILLPSFPYHVDYVIDGEDMVVIGVIHTSRQRGIWTSRIPAGDE